MTFNTKLLIAGLAIGVSAYIAYKASKKHEQHHIQSGQQYQWKPPQQFITNNSYNNNNNYSSGGQPPPPPPKPGQDVLWAALRDPNHIADLLSACVTDQHLYAFYDFAKIHQIASHIAHSGALYDCCEAWKLPPSLGQDLVKLALFDISFLLDDSLSMQSEGNLRRDALKCILERAADAGARFDPDGMECSWMNAPNYNPIHIRNPADASEVVRRCRFDGKLTPMGASLENLLAMNVLPRAENNALHKPALIIIITDGRPTGHHEHDDKILRVIRHCKDRLSRTRYGPDAVSFSISAVGNDVEAQQWLDSLDADPQIGSLVDVTSDRRRESRQVQAKTGIELTEELHCLKVMLGGIDSTYDSSDEGSPSGAQRRASREAAMDYHRPSYETFETHRWQHHQREAARIGVPPPSRPHFIKEEYYPSNQSQQWMPPTNYDRPPQSYEPPSSYQQSQYESTASYQSASDYPNNNRPFESYRAPPMMQSSQEYNSPYPPSQAPYMSQQQYPNPYSQQSMPPMESSYRSSYPEQQGQSEYNAGPGGFVMPTAAPASSSSYGGYPNQGQRGEDDGNYRFPSAYS